MRAGKNIPFYYITFFLFLQERKRNFAFLLTKRKEYAKIICNTLCSRCCEYITKGCFLLSQYDVIIVGAGPAGIFTALEMLRRGSGQKILIVEKGQVVDVWLGNG